MRRSTPVCWRPNFVRVHHRQPVQHHFPTPMRVPRMIQRIPVSFYSTGADQQSQAKATSTRTPNDLHLGQKTRTEPLNTQVGARPPTVKPIRCIPRFDPKPLEPPPLRPKQQTEPPRNKKVNNVNNARPVSRATFHFDGDGADSTQTRINHQLQHGDIDTALDITLQYHKEGNPPLRKKVYSALLSTAILQENETAVQQILDLLANYKIPYNDTLYSLHLSWLASQGRNVEAERLINEMIATPIYITSNSVTAILNYIRKYQLDRDRIQKILNIIDQQNMQLSEEDYYHLLSISSRFGFSQLFLKVYKDFISDLSNGKVKDFPLVWPTIIYEFLSKKYPQSDSYVHDALMRMKNYTDQSPGYWKSLLRNTLYSNDTSRFRKILAFLQQHELFYPDQETIVLYVRCLYRRVIFQPLKVLPEFITRMTPLPPLIRLPPDIEVLAETQQLILFAEKNSIKLTDQCYNGIILALARARHYTVMQKLLFDLNSQENKEFELNIDGITGIITAIASDALFSETYASLSTKEERLEAIDKLKQQALDMLDSKDACLERFSMSVFYDSLMHAYALLEEPMVTKRLEALAVEMKTKSLVPSMLLTLSSAFELHLPAVVKLVKIVQYYWPELAEMISRFGEHFAFARLVDLATKQEEVSVMSPADKENENVYNKTKQTLIHVIESTIAVVGSANDDIFLRWAQLLSFYGNSYGIEVVIDAVQEMKSHLKQRPTTPTSMYWYWFHFASALLAENKLDEAIAVIDRMKTAGVTPLITIYHRLIRGCTSKPEKAVEIYNKLIMDGLKPDAKLFEALIKVLQNDKRLLDQIKPELDKYNIMLV